MVVGIYVIREFRKITQFLMGYLANRRNSPELKFPEKNH